MNLELIAQSLSSLSDETVKALGQTNSYLEEWAIPILMARKGLNIDEYDINKARIIAFFDEVNSDKWIEEIIKWDYLDLLITFNKFIKHNYLDLAYKYNAGSCFEYLLSKEIPSNELIYEIIQNHNIKFVEILAINDKLKYEGNSFIRPNPNYTDIIKQLIEEGFESIIKSLAEAGKIIYSHHINGIIKNGWIDIIKILIKNRIKFTLDNIYRAIDYNKHDIVKIFVENNLVNDNFHIISIIKEGWIDIIDILIKKGLNSIVI